MSENSKASSASASGSKVKSDKLTTRIKRDKFFMSGCCLFDWLEFGLGYDLADNQFQRERMVEQGMDAQVFIFYFIFSNVLLCNFY